MEKNMYKKGVIDVAAYQSIEREENRKRLIEYMNYMNLCTYFTDNTVRVHFYCLRTFLRFLDEEKLDIHMVEGSHIYSYVCNLGIERIENTYFNQKLRIIFMFYELLRVRGEIEQNPIDISLYYRRPRKKEYYKKMDTEIRQDLLHKLKCFPYKIRLMLLLLLIVGLTKEEVFKLRVIELGWEKGNAYIKPQHNGLIRYVPIPNQIYLLLFDYIENNKIPEYEYFFKNKIGELYNAMSFRKYIMALCKRHKIGNEEYVLKGAGYRSYIMNEMYDMGVSTTVIREFMGYSNEETVYNHINYYVRELEAASSEYFEKHNLVKEIKERGYGKKLF